MNLATNDRTLLRSEATESRQKDFRVFRVFRGSLPLPAPTRFNILTFQRFNVSVPIL
jgi:hypothetical protein